MSAKEKDITVLYVAVSKDPEVRSISNNLEEMQALVGGYIEEISVRSNGEACVLICNEEGLIKNLPKNRRIYNHMIVGNFFICGVDEDGNCTSLSEEVINKLIELFQLQKLLDRDWL